MNAATGGEAALGRRLRAPNPVSLVLLFGFQGGQILAQPLVILLLALPILIQVYGNAGLAYLLNRQCGSAHSVAGPSALIGASNFFELAVAAAIALAAPRWRPWSACWWRRPSCCPWSAS